MEIIKKENKELREALAQLQQVGRVSSLFGSTTQMSKERARGGGGGSITAEIEKVQGQVWRSFLSNILVLSKLSFVL